VDNYILEVRKSIPQKICNKIISYYDQELIDAKITAGLNKEIRNCLRKEILIPKTFGETILSNYIKSKVFELAKSYEDRHAHVCFQKISQLEILKYEANDYDAGYKFHVDFGTTCTKRLLSISINLNSDFEGGEFVFDLSNQFKQFPQNIGDAIIFPSNFMFPHQVNKITKGVRYSLIAWVV